MMQRTLATQARGPPTGHVNSVAAFNPVSPSTVVFEGLGAEGRRAFPVPLGSVRSTDLCIKHRARMSPVALSPDRSGTRTMRGRGPGPRGTGSQGPIPRRGPSVPVTPEQLGLKSCSP